MINELKTVVKINDKWLLNLIKSELPEKIQDENLENLLDFKNKHFSIIENQSLIELFNQNIHKEWMKSSINMQLDEIIELTKYCENDEFSTNLIAIELEKRFPTKSLEKLLESQDRYSSIINSNPTIANIFENTINKQIKDIGIESIIGYFELSGGYISQLYASLFLKIADNLTKEQWEKILKSFLQNDQIYRDQGSCKYFKELFKKSYKIHNGVLTCWQSFLKELNKLNGNTYTINLKYSIERLIQDM